MTSINTGNKVDALNVRRIKRLKLRTVPTNSMVFLPRFMIMQGM